MNPVAPECAGCSRVSPHAALGHDYCKAYGTPSSWFRNGKRCPLGDHYAAEVTKKAFINPLKLSKMRKKGLA